ncbi:MAG: HAD-IA family hydrolase [bacterium]|nr:HAD-IA family hydrolase [bacterium]
MQLLCFDLDNTLVRSSKAHIQAFKKAFKKNKLKIKTDKKLLEFFSLESSQLIKKLYPALKEKQREKVVMDHDAFLIKDTIKYTKAIPGAKETLNKLKKDYEIAILSNCKHKEILAILKATKINKNHFDKIIGNDDVKHPKPAPDEIIKAKQLLKLNDGYMIGDSIYDIRAGKKAKVKTIAVCTGNHTKAQLQKEKPYAILKSIKNLEKFLKKEASHE